MLLTIKENFNNQELAIIYSNLGISQFYLGEKAAGLDSLDLANATDPTYAPGFYFAGIIYLDQGDQESGKKFLERAIDLDFTNEITFKAEQLLAK